MQAVCTSSSTAMGRQSRTRSASGPRRIIPDAPFSLSEVEGQGNPPAQKRGAYPNNGHAPPNQPDRLTRPDRLLARMNDAVDDILDPLLTARTGLGIDRISLGEVGDPGQVETADLLTEVALPTGIALGLDRI